MGSEGGVGMVVKRGSKRRAWEERSSDYDWNAKEVVKTGDAG